MQQGSQEWHNFRNSRIGSSDAPVIMGVSPYKNIHDLFLEKTGKKEPKPVNKFVTEKGDTYEDLALLDLEDHTNLVWKREVFVSEENEKWISSVDGHAVQNINEEMINLLWECKYVGQDKYNKFINDLLPLRDRVSEQYYPQLIHHCLITGGRRGYFSVVVDKQVFPSLGSSLKFVHLEFKLTSEDVEYLETVYKPELIKFTKNLASGVAPSVDPTVEYISVEDSELEELLAKYKVVDSELKPRKKELETLKKNIFEIALSYNKKVEICGNKINVSESEPKQFIDYELLVKENPHIIKGIDIEHYKRFTGTRTTKKITLGKDKK